MLRNLFIPHQIDSWHCIKNDDEDYEARSLRGRSYDQMLWSSVWLGLYIDDLPPDDSMHDHQLQLIEEDTDSDEDGNRGRANF